MDLVAAGALTQKKSFEKNSFFAVFFIITVVRSFDALAQLLLMHYLLFRLSKKVQYIYVWDDFFTPSFFDCLTKRF